MAFITADRVKDTSTTTGTGNITVSGSAPLGYRTFSTVLSVGDTFYYCVQGQASAEWEIGIGTYASTNQFARTTVLSSSASGSAVSFSSGTKNVFITLAASKTLQLGPSDGPTAGSVPYGTGSTLAYTAAGISGQVLTSNGSSAPTWTSVSGTGTVTSVNVSGGTTGLTYSGGPVTTSGTITMAGTLAVANGGTGVTSSTGSGNNVLSASPTLTGTLTVPVITSAAATALTFQSASTTAMTIDTSGNVGIGTSSPGYKFDVVKGSVGDVARFTNGVDASLIVGAPTGGITYNQLNGGYQSWQIASSEKMRISANGNVSIGPSATPSERLYVQNTYATVWTPGTSVAQVQAFNATSTNNGTSLYGAAVNYGDGTYCGVQFGAVASGPYTGDFVLATRNAGTWQESLRVTGSGNVGIGTSSPNASAILDAQSTTKGVRFPNMTTTQKNAISSPAAGLVVFDTTLAKLCVYSGSAWQTVTSV